MPLLDNDIVQQTADGSVAAFNVELPGLDYLVLRWDGTSSHPVINGMLLGLSAAGDRVLAISGDMTIVDMDGFATTIALGMIAGRGSLSADGDRVIGAAYSGSNGGAQLARANVSTGEIELLGEVAQTISRAYSTADGGTIAGFGDNFSWTPDNPLGDADGTAFIANGDGLTLGLPGTPDGVEIWPEAVSSDGTVIAGRAATTGRHFRWTEAGGYVELAGASWRSETYLSADGAVVLGSLVPEGGTADSAAFRWTQATGAVNLTPGRTSLATDLSADGNVIVATSWEDAQIEGASPEDTFMWDATHGTRTLDEILADRAVDATGWEFGHARSLSDDGKVLLGRARCGGTPTLYRIVLSD